MPKLNRGGKVKRSELPSTVRRSGAKAQRTFAKTHDAAVEQYGEGERAHRAAYASLKHTHEKVGGRWVEKDELGASDPRSGKTTASSRRCTGRTPTAVSASSVPCSRASRRRKAKPTPPLEPGPRAKAPRQHSLR